MTTYNEDKQLSKAAAIAIIVAAVLFALSLTSCKTSKEIEVHEMAIRDTIIEHSTDTLIVERVKHDSINVYIFDTSYVDAVGTQHHDRKEIRYNGSSVSNEEYRSILADNERLRSQVEELKNEKEVVKEVEKKYMFGGRLQWHSLYCPPLCYSHASIKNSKNEDLQPIGNRNPRHHTRRQQLTLPHHHGRRHSHAVIRSTSTR